MTGLPDLPAPTDRFQVEFLIKIQRLLAEGEFTATYKFALLSALADIAIEKGDDNGWALRVKLDDIAEKFISFYWRQALPYRNGRALEHSTGKQAKIIQEICKEQEKSGTLTAFVGDRKRYRSLVGRVRNVIKVMPLWKLQTLGGQKLPFLYEEKLLNGEAIELKPGVAACLRRFHGLIEDLVRGAWVRFIRRLPKNRAAVGESLDLPEFLFGSERDALAAFKPILGVLQEERCFFCRERIPMGKQAIDHFVPWSLFPNDLGHNFVLADATCNSQKSDALAAVDHLKEWWRQVADHGRELGTVFDKAGIVHDEASSKRVARWAYTNAEMAASQLWKKGKEFEPIHPTWRSIMAT